MLQQKGLDTLLWVDPVVPFPGLPHFLPHFRMTGLPTILTHLSESKKGIENEEPPEPEAPEAAEAPTPCAEPEWLGRSGMKKVMVSRSYSHDMIPWFYMVLWQDQEQQLFAKVIRTAFIGLQWPFCFDAIDSLWIHLAIVQASTKPGWQPAAAAPRRQSCLLDRWFQSWLVLRLVLRLVVLDHFEEYLVGNLPVLRIPNPSAHEKIPQLQQALQVQPRVWMCGLRWSSTYHQV